MNILVIGGGPSGMMAAISAAQSGAKVVLCEQNEKTGKKLYISGKGRCNVTNDCSVADFLPNVVTNPRFLQSALHKFPPASTLQFLAENGLETKTERGNRVFPLSDKSSDVIKTFNRVLQNLGVEVRLNQEVLSVQQAEKGFDVTTRSQGVTSVQNYSAVVVATGGYSYRATGSTGFGYRLAQSFGHNVVTPKPALCRILCKGTQSLEGLSLKNAQISFVNNSGKVVAQQFGEMLFTDDGVSGPAALSLSCQINRQPTNSGSVVIDLKPALDRETLNARLLRDFSERMNKDFANALDALLPQRLIDEVVLQSKISPHKKVNQITAEERRRLCDVLKGLCFPYVGLDDLNFAIVTSGGVDVSQVNPSTMESKLVKGLYFAGEVLDVDAYTGGYNIQIALATGHLAGASAAKSCTIG